MSDPCLKPDELGHLLAAPRTDLRWAHVSQCARCRSLVSSYRSFLAGNQAQADPQADRELDRRLAREIQGPVGVPGSKRFLKHRYFTTSLALAAVLATVLVLQWPDDLSKPGPLVIRGEKQGFGETITTHPVQSLGGSELRLAWSPVSGARAYLVRVVGSDLSEIDRQVVDGDTVLVITFSWEGEGGGLLWQVEAVDAGGRVARSALTPLQLP